LVTAGLLASACEQRSKFRYETQHLRIATDFEEPLCRGDLDHYERVIATLESELDTTVEGTVDVHLWDLRMAPPGWCELENASGCFGDGVVYADQLSIDHELVHVVVATVGDPAAFWSEGAAVSLQSDRTILNGSTPVENLDLEAPLLDYQTAGHFSRWLLETWGIERYRALLRASGSAQATFEQTYDITIEEAQQQYFAEAPYSYGAFITCDYPDIPQIGNMRWSERIEIDCDNPYVYGGPIGIGAYRVLTITEAGNYTFLTSAEAGLISACPDQDFETEPMAGDPALGDVPPLTGGFMLEFEGEGVPRTLELIPGRYELAVGYSDYEARTAQLDVWAMDTR
jgi:hypothetical protein